VTYLLDANTCVGWLRKNQPQIVARIQAQAPTDIVLCSVVVGELLFGVERSDPVQPGVAPRLGPHSGFARHHAVAAAPAGKLVRSAAEDHPMADGKEGARCPRCGSAALDPGTMGSQGLFYRSAGPSINGWRLDAFVCLDCGWLTQYVGASDLDKLREKNGLSKRDA
jgi:hypothetical protein